MIFNFEKHPEMQLPDSFTFSQYCWQTA